MRIFWFLSSKVMRFHQSLDYFANFFQIFFPSSAPKIFNPFIDYWRALMYFISLKKKKNSLQWVLGENTFFSIYYVYLIFLIYLLFIWVNLVLTIFSQKTHIRFFHRLLPPFPQAINTSIMMDRLTCKTF